MVRLELSLGSHMLATVLAGKTKKKTMLQKVIQEEGTPPPNKTTEQKTIQTELATHRGARRSMPRQRSRTQPA